MADTLEGTTGVVFGVANKRSIAWAIAKELKARGASLAFNYLEAVEDRVRGLVEDEMPGSPVHPCDVTSDEEIDAFFETVDEEAPDGIDFLVHSVAYAPRDALMGRYVETPRDGWQTALEVSAYSLVALARRARPLMEKRGGGSIVAMTYLGSERVVPNYNVMGVAKAALEASVRYLAEDLGPEGIRVNGISAGPVNTLSARGISGFREMLEAHAEKAALRRNIDVEEVARTAAFLLSDEGSGITGDTLFVDAGYHIMGA